MIPQSVRERHETSRLHCRCLQISASLLVDAMLNGASVASAVGAMSVGIVNVRAALKAMSRGVDDINVFMVDSCCDLMS